MTTILQLIARARELFDRDVNGLRVREDLVALMNRIAPDDFSARLLALDKSGWQTEDLCTTSEFSVTMFTIPRGHAIPFHDHPSMSVLMRTLCGHLKVHAYDWTRREPWGGVARHTYDVSMNGDSDTLIIEPGHGNIHQVVARSDSVFLDVAFPPYSDEQGRSCEFYQIAAGEPLIDREKLTRLITIQVRSRSAASAIAP